MEFGYVYVCIYMEEDKLSPKHLPQPPQQTATSSRIPPKEGAKKMVFFLKWVLIMAGQPTPPPVDTYPPHRNKGLIAGLIKGNQWLIRGGWLTGHNLRSEDVGSFNLKVWTTLTCFTIVFFHDITKMLT